MFYCCKKITNYSIKSYYNYQLINHYLPINNYATLIYVLN